MYCVGKSTRGVKQKNETLQVKLSLEPRETGRAFGVANKPWEDGVGVGGWPRAAECVGVTMGPSTEASLWSSKPFAEQFSVRSSSNSKQPPPQVNAKNLLCDSQFCYAEREVIEKILPGNFILNRGGVVAK